MRKRSKQMHTDSYLYVEVQLGNFMMSTKKLSNLRGLVRTQMIITQNMINPQGCSIDKG